MYSQILDSSLAKNRVLRHFFMDMLLLSDCDGNVILTPDAIGKRTGWSDAEVAWGLEELQKPDRMSRTPANNGCRIVPLDGHGYGWQIVNYAQYRDYRTAAEVRAATAERVRRWRERHKGEQKPTPEQRFEEGREEEYQKRRKLGLREATHAGQIQGAREAIADGLEDVATAPT